MLFEVSQGSLNVLQRFECDTVDKMESTIPIIMLSASEHTAYVNTVTLRAVFDLDNTGYDSFEKYKEVVNASGGLHEMEQIYSALKAVPKLQLSESTLKLKEGLDGLFRLATKHGVTMLSDAAMYLSQKDFLGLYLSLHPLSIRVGFALLCTSKKEANKLDNYNPIATTSKIFQGNVKIV